MVEGHQCHRVGAAHRRLLIGKAFEATSPNGRFVEGAAAITGKVLSRIEVHGKNLFYFFTGSSSGSNGSGPGSSSAAAAGTTPPPAAAAAAAAGQAVLSPEDEDPLAEPDEVHRDEIWGAFRTSLLPGPEPTATTRLRLLHSPSQLMAHLSAMTVQHGGLGLYQEKVSKLGPDPLRPSDDKERFWARVSSSRKPIGLLLMDQSAVAGVGNIYRAEILFKSRVHPEQPGNSISRAAFDTIWGHCVELLQRGFSSGSILTVDPEDAKTLGKPWTRRYIYNQRQCGFCKGPVTTWDMAGRTVYCCSTCQPLQLDIASGTAAAAAAAEAGKQSKSRKRPDSKSSKQDSTAAAGAAAGADAAAAAKQLLSPSRLKSMAAAQVAKEFVSHCAPDDPAELPPSKMTCALLRQALLALSMDARGTKQRLVERLEAAQAAMAAAPAAAAAAAAAAGGGVAVQGAGSSSSEDELDRAEERLAGNLSVPAAKRRRVARKPTAAAAAAAAADSAAAAAPVTPSPKPSSSTASRRRRPRSTAASPPPAAAAVPAGGNDPDIASASAAAAEKAAAGENRAVEHVALFADAATEAMMFGGEQQE
ncbi:hypothetical protein OEZ86_010738 [Tetradesmus obliquus]|nr:hypothetical protein OEZ86_010738 [Tetradesmus obliquus]